MPGSQADAEHRRGELAGPAIAGADWVAGRELGRDNAGISGVDLVAATASSPPARLPARTVRPYAALWPGWSRTARTSRS